MTTHTTPSPGAMRAAEKICDRHGYRLSMTEPHAVAAIFDAETWVEELAELLEEYVVIEETSAPYSSSPLRERARAALDRYRKGGE